MKRIRAAMGLLVLAIAGGAAAQVMQPSPTPAPGSVQRAARPALQALADRYVAERKAPGIVIMTGQGDAPASVAAAGRIAADPSAGRADADSLWRVYSMTKPITAVAAMMLIEDGKLRLDQPISDFFPGFKEMKVLTDPANSLASRPAKTPITVRHLLTHTAGLGYSIVTKGPLLKEYERLGIIPGAINAQVEPQMAAVRPRSLTEFAERTATLPLIAEPGTTWSYSIGMDLLGAVIEKAGGMPFHAFLKARLFDPLGMTSTYWTVPQDAVKRFASNYTFVGDNMVPIDPAATSVYLQPPSFPYGGAGLVTSAADYDRFLHMLLNRGALNGRRVMKAETVALAMSDLLPSDVTFDGVDAATGGTKGPKMGYGAGGSIYLEDVPGGPGAGTYGWGGAAGTIAWVDPKNGVRGTVMVNYFPSDKWPLRQDVTRTLYAKLRR